MLLLLSILLTQAPAAERAAVDASKVTFGAPSTLAIVDMDKIKGEPWRLTWSPDGSQLLLTAMKRARDGSMELTHHLIDVAGGKMEKVDAEPEWSTEYWGWKSHRSAPGNAALAIELDQQRKNESATSRPMGGELARGGVSGGAGASIDDVANQTSSNLLVITLLLKGAVLGQWKGEPFVPGLTFGWAPAGMDAIAFSDPDKRLVVMDEEGRKKRVDDTKDVRLPAWSTDGQRLAWAERQDRKKFRIQIAAID
jgi:dipeptidyl aminopeptidase/acylaminoacyl peptidase